ncbi:msl0174 [Mesorhizobium japonicum MAFF 303099]|uniref:Msl0174 protein n=1 Tax=Mesorhizobium japonicum (strain LMG 29417 / CECT 9101 / MAFF 303099) TaxID=266835 RepID=Q98NE6_RHILO|nr:msl0174 [Mesorhizobium japonicum MAFF 303099]
MLMLFIDVSSCVLLACLLSGRTYKPDHSMIELNFP